VETRWGFLRLHAGAAVVEQLCCKGKHWCSVRVVADKLSKSSTLKGTDMATAQELAAKKKAMEDAAAAYQAAVQLSREEDLKTAKELIARHEFKTADLKPELKTTRTATKKPAAKKSTRRKS
jgi:hypothetical protein